MPNHRRQFLAALAASTTLAGLPAAHVAAAETPPRMRNPICVFTKPFNSLSFDQLAEHVARLGYDGIEAPIRRGGHIDPANVTEQLPKLVEALAKHDLSITVMTTDVNDPSDPRTERVLRTAATLGIQRYRMKYFHYQRDRAIEEQLANWHDLFVDLAAMNHDLGLTGLYQNHAGTRYLGAPVWDLDRVLDGIPPSDLGMAYDIRHATVEGGTSWPTTFRMIRDHIQTVYVKDFVWDGDKVRNVPLGEGLVDPRFFKMLAESGYEGPISLHEEYLDHRDPALVPKHLQAIERDLKTLREMMASA